MWHVHQSAGMTPPTRWMKIDSGFWGRRLGAAGASSGDTAMVNAEDLFWSADCAAAIGMTRSGSNMHTTLRSQFFFFFFSECMAD